MRIEEVRDRDAVTLRLTGRLDREWADQLSGTLADLLQDGARRLTLDLGGVTYASSAAATVLGRWREELTMLRGWLHLTSVVPAVREMLLVSGWDADDALPGARSGQLRLQQSAWFSRSSGWVSAVECQVTTLDAGAALTCTPCERTAVQATVDGFGLGVGAIGTVPAECRRRMGELLAVAGGAAYFPSDGARVPDFLVAAPGSAGPVVIDRGLWCTGSPARLIRFARHADAGAVPLSELATVCLDAARCDVAGVVLAAETKTLCGARLRRAPAERAVPLDAPNLREWLSFVPGVAGRVATALVAGVVARSPEPRLAALLRPLGEDLHAHFHAAIFAYAPLPQRTVELPALVQALFRQHELRDVLHLIRDDRGDSAVPESGFVRGMAWVAPIASISEPLP
jgi:anti-anti-sigma factor